MVVNSRKGFEQAHIYAILKQGHKFIIFINCYRLPTYWCPIVIKGYLKLFFLKKIKASECTGYDLISSAETVLGKKPSTGSVYPLLNQLLTDKYIKLKEENRKKIYSITKKGEILLKNLMDEKRKLLQSHEKIMYLFNEIHDDSSLKKSFLKINEALKFDNKVILRNMDLFLELKNELDAIFFNENLSFKKEQEVKVILKDFISKLKVLRQGLK